MTIWYRTNMIAIAIADALPYKENSQGYVYGKNNVQAYLAKINTIWNVNIKARKLRYPYITIYL